MTNRPPAETADEPAIKSAHATWIAAVNAGDLERLLTLVTDDVVFINPGREPVGREKFSTALATAHQQARIHCVSELEETVVVGEVAYTRSTDAVTVTSRAGGEAMQLAGHRITIYRSSVRAGGSWPATCTRCCP